MQSLNARFARFARQIPGAEPIDELALTAEQSSAKKADFFFDERRVISEVKSLRADTKDKIGKILAPYRETPEWPLYYGEWDLHRVLARLPDGERLEREIFKAATSAVPKLMRDANRQIRDTRVAFGLPSADGFLVILNDLVEILSPDVLAHAVATGLRKRTEDGRVRFPCLGVVWIINETHVVPLSPSLNAKVAVVLTSSSIPPTPATESFVVSLQPRWASYNGLPMVDLPAGPITTLDFKEISKVRPLGQMKRHEVWRAQYEQRPYLRGLSKDQLLEHGEALVGQLAPKFLKAGPQYSGEENLLLWERWTHFEEEVNFRAIDLREYAPRITARWKKQFGQFGEKIKNTETQAEPA